MSVERFIGLIFLFMLHLYPLPAEAVTPPRQVPSGFDINDIEIELYTVGVGPELYMRYGHTLLGVHDLKSGQRFVYNWGMFSFDDPMFPIKFYLGDRTYWVGETAYQGIVRLYRDYENRDVWRDIIQFSNQQKAELLKVLNQALNEEKMFFRYEHFERNCSTIPRDLIDAALAGYAEKKLSQQPAAHNYRWYVRTHMGAVPALAWALDIAMNSKLDKPISAWEESFYPLKLREYLASLPVLDDAGNPVPGTSLLKADKQLVVATQEWRVDDPKFFYTALFILIFSIFILILSQHKLVKILVSVPLGVVFGTIGISMLISWLFSTHYDMHHNLNLLIFFPTDYLLIFAAKFTNRLWFKRYAAAHAIAFLVHTIVSFSGISSQDISRVNIIGLTYVIMLLLLSGLLTKDGFKLKIDLQALKSAH